MKKKEMVNLVIERTITLMKTIYNSLPSSDEIRNKIYWAHYVSCNRTFYVAGGNAQNQSMNVKFGPLQHINLNNGNITFSLQNKFVTQSEFSNKASIRKLYKTELNKILISLDTKILGFI